MRYLATPSGPGARAAIAAGLLAGIVTPAQGNILPEGAWWAADNGRFGKGWPGDAAWFAWLAGQVKRYGAERCLFALAPDRPFDAARTLAESRPWLSRIRELGVPAAFAAQDGCEALGMLPDWSEFDCLFLAGSTVWKTSQTAQSLAAEAKLHGLTVHMGRVNSLRRLRLAQWFGCDSADGTYLAYGPTQNLPKLLGWVAEVERTPTLLDAG